MRTSGLYIFTKASKISLDLQVLLRPDTLGTPGEFSTFFENKIENDM